ncbi:MAG TPA: D-cysteine desulfhydrase family protein [Anaerolineae bacterium]|nr:D-cysteine desulfhydrase family protein [Anaerolineae bacterium]
MTPSYLKREQLAHLPTPIEPMLRLTAHLHGPELWIKRDDQTGLAGGGNKTRKLEFLLAEALKQGCNHVVTVGGIQSNHCRQTAAAAAHLGLGCSLVLGADKPDTKQGNLLLSELLGAHLYYTQGRTRNEVADEVMQQLQAMGHNPYLIPLGGSNVVGATAYVLAMQELMQQLEAQQLNFDFIVFASSSGGTQAGMVLGAEIYGFKGRLLGISIDNSAETLKTHVSALAIAATTHLGLNPLPNLAQRVEVNDDYYEAGYAVLTNLEREAIKLVAQKEGILLDPVYTGRAMGALIDLIHWGAFTRGQKILFWHTGGMPALFAYNQQL